MRIKISEKVYQIFNIKKRAKLIIKSIEIIIIEIYKIKTIMKSIILKNPRQNNMKGGILRNLMISNYLRKII